MRGRKSGQGSRSSSKDRADTAESQQLVAKLAAELRVPQECLCRLRPCTIDAAMASWEPWARAAVELSVWQQPRHHDDSQEVLAKHFASESEMRMRPWLRGIEVARSELKLFSKIEKTLLAEQFAEAAKAGQLSCEEALLLQCLLMFDEEEQKQVAAAVLRWRGMERLQLFNLVAALREPEGATPTQAFIDERGGQLLRLETPLWPREKAFMQLQLQQFQAGNEVRGGETSPKVTSTFSQRHLIDRSTFSSLSPGFNTDQVKGGGYAPVGQLPDGSWATDTTTLENAQLALKRENEKLLRQIGGLERKVQRLQTDGHLGPAANEPATRGRGRGGYRGRTRRPVGGGDIDDKTAPDPSQGFQ